MLASGSIERRERLTLRTALAGIIIACAAAPADAKTCSPDEILTLAKQGFTKSDVAKVCENAGDTKEENATALLLKAFIAAGRAGSKDVGAELHRQGKWSLARTPSGTSIIPFIGEFEGWTLEAEPRRITIFRKFAPQSQELSVACSNLQSGLNAAVGPVLATLPRQSSPFSDDGRGSVNYGAEVWNGPSGNLQIYLSCAAGAVDRHSQGMRQHPASARLAIEHR